MGSSNPRVDRLLKRKKPVGVSSADADSTRPAPQRVPLLLCAIAFGILFFPSNMVLSPLGAVGSLPMVLALVLGAFYVVSVVTGLHDPIGFRHPGRIGLALLLLSTCISYVLLYAGLTGGSIVPARAAADRWLLLVLASAAVASATTESVRTQRDVLRLVRWLMAGAFFCGLVALIQFVFTVNPMEWVAKAMPGFVNNGGDTPFQERGSLTRVAGSTFHSIELAAVAAMLLPLSVWRAVYDDRGRKWFHWATVALLIFALSSTVSRTSLLGALIALIVFVPFLGPVGRRWVLVLTPIAVGLLFLLIPGLIGTLSSSVTAGEDDPSVANRTNNYPRVAHMVSEHVFFGKGPGNYVAENATQILDNQYLGMTVTQGFVGLIAITFYLFLPGLAALLAALSASAPRLRALGGAVAAGGLVAATCSFTFDSFSFPVFALTYPFFVGLSGAIWMMVKKERRVLLDASRMPDNK